MNRHRMHLSTNNYSVARRLNGERLVLFGWSQAILLQLAHPLIAAGVAEHSAVRDGPRVAVRRLFETIRAMLALTFGDEALQQRTFARILAIHRRVHGVLREDVGRFPRGTSYSAEDPSLVRWVHVTLLSAIPTTYERLVGPLSEAERDRYCAEAEPTARRLGATGHVPSSWADVEGAVHEMLESGTLAVGADARMMAGLVLAPAFAPFVAPLARVNRLLTVGSLPAQVRSDYGLAWTAADARARHRWARLFRGARRATPDAVARWRMARISGP